MQCAVIQLPTQTLLLASTDKPGRMIGMLFPGVRVQEFLKTYTFSVGFASFEPVKTLPLLNKLYELIFRALP